MTHELKAIIHTAHVWQKLGKKAVLATVVHLDGSSYRRPGVRMLLSDAGDVVGAVSGGCVEKEIQFQAQGVFQTGKPKMMTYDGRFRLGCEGILYVLLEPFKASSEFFEAFDLTLENRKIFTLKSYFDFEVGEFGHIGTVAILGEISYKFQADFETIDSKECFSQTFHPLFQLFIFGAEHDAVQLCKAAHLLGWEVTIVANPKESKTLSYFQGAKALITPEFEAVGNLRIDVQTAVMMMTHSFNQDVQYLLALQKFRPAYFGLLGPALRRERLMDKLIEHNPEIDLDFIEQFYGPAGIHIGAENAGEIAVSILAEILSVTRKIEAIPLRDKIGKIHD